MEMTIQNLPFFYLIWITIGVVFILIGIVMLVAHENESGYYTDLTKATHQQNKEDLEGILSYFLEEEEKKNQGFREMLEGYAKEIGKPTYKVEEELKAQEDTYINEIIALLDQGLSVEEIARKLKKGVGEVQLILSLYKMR